MSLFLKSVIKLLVAAVIIVAPTLLYAASPSKTVVMLFDVSESTRKAHIRSQYQKDLEVILKNLHAGDALAADRIAENSAASSTLPINLELEGGWNTNDLKKKKVVRDARKQAKDAANTILSADSKVKYTDILSSLHIAERIFKTYNKERNVLVIMSDMVEDSKSYNFEKEKLTDKRIVEIIAKEKKAGRIPDLKNVKVYAIKNATSQSREKMEGVENFWLQYFKQSGAQIDKTHYGPLTRFE